MTRTEQLAEERYPYNHDGTLTTMPVNDIIEKQRAAFIAGYEADKWIRVEDDLPEESGRYLGFIEEIISKLSDTFPSLALFSPSSFS